MLKERWRNRGSLLSLRVICNSHECTNENDPLSCQVKIIHSNFVKKLKNSKFYELRIKAGNEYRVLIFAIDHLNFSECTKAVCLNGFIKKSNKDYVKAIREAEKILEEYLKSKEL